MSFDHITHHYSKTPESGTYVVTRITPIVRLSCLDGTLFMQSGRVLDEGGNEITDPPGWFYDEAAKITQQALLECGFKERPTRPSSAEHGMPMSKMDRDEHAEAKSALSDKWQCTDCGSVIGGGAKGKAEHLAAHNRKRAAGFEVK